MSNRLFYIPDGFSDRYGMTKEQMEKPHRSFIKGAAILAVVGLISKVIGLISTMLYTNVIGPDGMAPYMTAFPVYTFLLAVSSAGLPVAISKMVSERIALGDYRAAHIVFKKAMRYMVTLGLITTVVMIVFSTPIAVLLGRQEASLTITAIAPSLFFVAILSAYRGYFQGMQRMTPTAISQLIEQIVKLAAGQYLAVMWIGKGAVYGAAGAILGVTISEIAAFLYVYILYRKNFKSIKINLKNSVRTHLRHGIGKKMFYLAMPIIIGACAMPLVQLADSAIITNTLMGMKSIILFGKEVIINKEVVDNLYGLTGYVNPIINMPAILSTALGMSLVPSISASNIRKDGSGVSAKSSTALKLSMLVGLPCTAGLYLLSTPIIHLLFQSLQDVNKDPNIAQLHLLSTGGDLLATMAAAVFFLTILQTMSGILQGLGKTYLPVVNLLIGVAVKIVLSIVLIRIPSVNIQGAFIGTLVCYAIAAILDIIFVIKYTKAPLNIINNFVRPLCAAAVMGLFVYVMDQSPFMRASTPRGTTLLSMPVTIITILGAMVIYFIAVLIFGAVNSEDMQYIPGGRKITSFMIKLHLWKAKV